MENEVLICEVKWGGRVGGDLLAVNENCVTSVIAALTLGVNGP